MQITFIDFESTGLDTKSALPVSMAYLTIDERLTAAVTSGVLYFHKPGINYDCEAFAGARAIHGLTEAFLKPHEPAYYENVNKAFALMNYSNLSGYNIKNYDYKLALSLFAREGFNVVKQGSILDVMSVYQPIMHKRMKLKDLCAACGLSDEVINIMHKKWFGVDGEYWHDASWDVTATAMLYIQALKKGYI